MRRGNLISPHCHHIRIRVHRRQPRDHIIPHPEPLQIGDRHLPFFLRLIFPCSASAVAALIPPRSSLLCPIRQLPVHAERHVQRNRVVNLRHAALFAPPQPPRVAVLQILADCVSDPSEPSYPAVLVPIDSDLHRYHILRVVSGAQLRRCFLLVLHINAVTPFNRLLRHRHANKIVIHIVRVLHTRLRNDLLRMQHAQAVFSDGGVRPLACVPLHQKPDTALLLRRPLRLVVDRLHRNPLQFIAQHILDLPRKRLVLLPKRHDLWHRNRGVYNGVNVLRRNVPYMRRLPILPVLRSVIAGRRSQLPIPVILPFPLVHLDHFRIVRAHIPIKPFFPLVKLFPAVVLHIYLPLFCPYL